MLARLVVNPQPPRAGIDGSRRLASGRPWFFDATVKVRRPLPLFAERLRDATTGRCFSRRQIAEPRNELTLTERACVPVTYNHPCRCRHRPGHERGNTVTVTDNVAQAGGQRLDRQSTAWTRQARLRVLLDVHTCTAAAGGDCRKLAGQPARLMCARLIAHMERTTGTPGMFSSDVRH